MRENHLFFVLIDSTVIHGLWEIHKQVLTADWQEIALKKV